MLLSKLIYICISAHHSRLTSCQNGNFRDALSLLLMPVCVCVVTEASLTMALRQDDLLTGLGCHEDLLLWCFVGDSFCFTFFFKMKSNKSRKKKSERIYEHGCIERQTAQCAHQLV